jgi:hypothetical protein
VKVYDTVFFLFCLPRPSTAPVQLIECIQRNIGSFAQWDKEYVWNGIYDPQEKYLRKDLENAGLDFDNG